MKKYAGLLLLSALVAGLSAWAAVRGVGCKGCGAGAVGAGGDLDWLRREFKLTDVQERAIVELNAGYRAEMGRCDQELCGVRCGMNSVLFDRSTDPAVLDQAVDELVRVQVRAERATLHYFRAVHGVLDPKQGARYAAAVGRCVCGSGLSCNRCGSGSACTGAPGKGLSCQ